MIGIQGITQSAISQYLRHLLRRNADAHNSGYSRPRDSKLAGEAPSSAGPPVNWLLVPIAAYVCLISAYMLVITAGAWLYRSPGDEGGRHRRFAVVIPAHNEGTGILPTLQDLRHCDYPAECVSLFVIADNCTDDTAAIAHAEGANVIERHDLSARGKGQALDWFLKNHQRTLEPFDVVTFVDADMFVDHRFFAALDTAFADPAVEAAQARYTIANPGASWFAAFGYLSFAYVNHLRPAGRSFLGGSAGLKGSGMAFRSRLILETGWPAASLAEDVEFGKMLVLRGIRIHYVPDSIVTSNIGGQLRQANVQQSRWEGGKLQVSLQYFPKLIHRLASAPRWLLAEELLDTLVPPLSVVVALTAVGSALSWFAGSPALLIPFAIAALIFAAAVLSALVQLRSPVRVFLYLAASPAFVLLKIALLLKLAIAGHAGGWTRTPRDSERN